MILRKETTQLLWQLRGQLYNTARAIEKDIERKRLLISQKDFTKLTKEGKLETRDGYKLEIIQVTTDYDEVKK